MSKIIINRGVFLIAISIIIGFIFGFTSANYLYKAGETSSHLLLTCHFDTTDYVVVDTFSIEEYKLMSNPPVLVDLTPQDCDRGYVRTPETAALMALSQCKHPYLDKYGEHYISHFNIYLCDSTWFVEHGFSGSGIAFGGFNMEIDKNTGEIVGFERFK